MEINERFTISVNDQGVMITGIDEAGERRQLRFTPIEAVMLMDILQHEAARIRQAAEDSIPLSLNLRLDTSPSVR